MSLMEDLLALERGFWAAAGHPEYYEQQFATDGLVIFAFQGGIMDRSAVLTTTQSSPPWQRYDIGNPRLVQLANDAVALVYLATAQRDGQEEYRANIASVYARRDGAWKLVLHQQSPIG